LRDRALEVLHRPGHSPSDTIFWDAGRRILVAGDHLIKHISSNPLISRPLGTSSEDSSDAVRSRPRALVTYLASLRKTRELPARIVLSGHGEPITDHASLIDERLAFHGRRAEKIHDLIAEQPRTGYELAQELFGNVAVTQAYLTLSEVLGHTDLLLEEGRVTERERDGVVYFEAAH
jgi:glyoxylase-like metal-dependent hydrolase (beta-lactamase superfamily II)